MIRKYIEVLLAKMQNHAFKDNRYTNYKRYKTCWVYIVDEWSVIEHLRGNGVETFLRFNFVLRCTSV